MLCAMFDLRCPASLSELPGRTVSAAETAGAGPYVEAGKYAPQYAWKARNPERQRAYNRAWLERNREARNERRRIAYAARKRV